MKKIRKRSEKINKIVKSKDLKIFGINCAGIKSKLNSFNEVLTRLSPMIWMAQETKLKANEVISCEALSAFQVFYLNRQESQGGGLAMGVVKDLESTLIREGNDDVEALVVKVVVDKIPIRTVLAYGPQENSKKEKKDMFWDFLEQEANQAELEEDGLIIQMDGNLRAGPSLVKNDPNVQNQNGKLFLDFLKRNPSLIVVNALHLCEGMITRTREFESRIEEAVLDFFIINERMLPFVKKMIIDEERNYPLSNFAQIKKNGKVIETDHNGLILELKMQVNLQKPDRVELFNMRNKVCQEAFKEETDNNTKLLECFSNDLPVKTQCSRWFRTLNNILHKCFRKVRVVNSQKKMEAGTDNLVRERVMLKKKVKLEQIDEAMRKKINHRIEEIENDIGDDIAKEFHKNIIHTLKQLGGENDTLNGAGRKKLWSLMKKKYPKVTPAFPVGKKDKSGNMMTNHMGLKHLYLDTYLHRLRNRPIKEDFQEIKDLKTELFNIRLKLAQMAHTDPWTLSHLDKALKSLKDDKARDIHGWVNEIFKEGVAGKNLKLSLLKLLNNVKDKNYIPEFMELADVATIYKGKGDKFNLENDRGIFIVTVLRSILMKLIYMDEYEVIDSSMSDSQIGARKGKNIRNHIWMVNGVICDVLSRKTKNPIDIQIFDYRQCFDSLWLEECLNDFYDGGLQNNKLALLYSVNRNVKVAVKTPVGKTERGTINNVITQGDVFGPLLCSKQVDSFGKECLDQNKYTYMYKGEVEIPPLGMVDDLLCISECGYKTTMVNSFIKFKTSSKKLQFGVQKCKKIHVGKYCEKFKCQTLSVDCWKELEVIDEETGIGKLEETCIGEEIMEEKSEEKYLGDIISNDGRNLKNIKARVSKGKGIVSKIMSIIDSIPFGNHYFEIGVILRDSLLSSSMLCNSETWYNITKAELNLLETIDVMLLRRILKAPKSTPKEMLFLELGCLPYKEIIKKKRLMFLQYILHEDPSSMVHKYFEAQMRNPTPKDWVTTVGNDLKELGMNVNFADIKAMSKGKFKSMLKLNIKKKAIMELEKKKSKHSKVNHIKHGFLKIQSYLMPSEMKMSNEERQLIFKLRSGVTNVKMNTKGMYDDYECELCGEENETQKHILECKELTKNNNSKRNIPNYEKLFTGNVKDKLEIARIFIENIKIRDEIKKSNGN